MTVCAKCGQKNADGDTVCRNLRCRAPLAPVGETAAEPEDGGDATAGRSDSTQSFDAASEAHRDDPEKIRPAAPRPAPPRSAPAPAAAGQPATEAQPDHEPAGAARPTAAGQPRPPRSVAKPGQYYCWSCGWGNDPGNERCQHCGATLAVPRREPAPERLPSARRSWAGGARRRALRRLVAVLGALAVLAAVAVVGTRLLRPGGGGTPATTTRGAQAARSFTLVRVRPTVEANSESGSRKAANLVDGNLSTFWSKSPNGPFGKLTFSFGQPVRLGRIAIAAGAPGAEFARRNRPKTIELTFSDGTTLTRGLADKPGFQNVDFSPRSVTQVTIRIADAYKAPETAPNHNRTSMSEVRFFTVT